MTAPGHGRWSGPELDDDAAWAVALMTLCASGTPDDAAMAARMLDGFVAADGGRRGIGGLAAVCATLLVLLEFETGATPEESLQRVGRLVAQAVGV